jgi:dienelactone hydrolase
LSSEELKNIIINSLNIKFLLNHLKSSSQLDVLVISSVDYRHYVEKELIINDKFIGKLHVLLLKPKESNQSKAAILALHGHLLNPKAFLFSEKLANAGYIVAIPKFRAMLCDKTEENTSKKLLLNGFTLMGLRVYESMLVVKYLQSLEGVKNIGAIAHSGGSSTLNLIVRIPNFLKAIVYDYNVNYLNFCSFNRIHCETIPQLYKYHPAINNPETLTIPNLKAAYEYSDISFEEIKSFFDNNLKAAGGLARYSGGPSAEVVANTQ